MARALEKVHNSFCHGCKRLNHPIIDLAEIATDRFRCKFELELQTGAEEGTYKADFIKFARTFFDFRFRWDAEEGAIAVSTTPV